MMRLWQCAVALGLLLWSPAGSAATRAVGFVFGPEGAEAAQESAKAAAGAAKRILTPAGTQVALWRAGVPDAYSIDSRMPARSVDSLLLTAARMGRDSDVMAFLNTVDSAAQALSRHAGSRTLVVVVEAVPLSGEAEASLKAIGDYCARKDISVVVLDAGGVKSKEGNAAWTDFARKPQGRVVRSQRELENALIANSQSGEDTAAPQAMTETLTALTRDLPALPRDLPIRIRFIRTSSNRTSSWGTQRAYSSGGGAGGGGIQTREGGANTESVTGVMRGLLVVEAPLSALKFSFDENARTYSAQAVVTQMVRNERGEAVWQARKAVTIKGPLSRLETRLQGSLFYLREVQLPGGRYTLEGLIEDVAGQKAGGVREPLASADGIPGFHVSDALFVRPFNGAADKFEADQVFVYDGEALSPILNAVFPANEPFDLRLYLVLYPDLYGAQPEMNLEVLRNGQVVGEAKLPFTDKIRDTAREGAGALKGEQKSQFPYMATLKGARLSAGSYEARVTVRQGKNLLRRTVPFRVTGNGPAEVAVDAIDGAAGPSSSAGTAAVVEELEVVLPEVDPVTIHNGEVAPSAEDQRRYWEEAAGHALRFSDMLPNFRCHQETRRLTAPIKNPDRFREGDVVLTELVYENGRESYRVLSINGLKTGRSSKAGMGVSSKGEFGTLLRSLFRPEVGATYRWAGRAVIGNSLCRVFDVEVKTEKSNFVLTHNLRQEVAGYKGRVFVEEESGLVRQLTIQGEGLPKDFALRSPGLSLEYGLVRVGAQDYLLPLRSLLQLQQGKTLVRNESVFRAYRKFEAESTIKY